MYIQCCFSQILPCTLVTVIKADILVNLKSYPLPFSDVAFFVFLIITLVFIVILSRETRGIM